MIVLKQYASQIELFQLFTFRFYNINLKKRRNKIQAGGRKKQRFNYFIIIVLKKAQHSESSHFNLNPDDDSESQTKCRPDWRGDEGNAETSESK